MCNFLSEIIFKWHTLQDKAAFNIRSNIVIWVIDRALSISVSLLFLIIHSKYNVHCSF